MTYETPAEGNNNKTLYIIIGVVAALLILCCCVIIIGAVVLNATGAISLPFTGPTLSETFISDDDYNAEFNYPEGWYADGSYGYYTISSVEDFDEMDEPVPGEFFLMIMVDSGDYYEGGNAEEILEEMLSDLDEEIAEVEISEPKSTKVGGTEAVYVSLKGDFLAIDADLDGLLVVWEINGEYFGEAIGFTAEDNFSQYKSTMEAILDSFTADVQLDY